MPKSDLDFYLRQALARWQAKNNYLVEKWSRVLNWISLTPLEHERVQEFLDDLNTPCDSFISDFDMRNCK